MPTASIAGPTAMFGSGGGGTSARAGTGGVGGVAGGGGKGGCGSRATSGRRYSDVAVLGGAAGALVGASFGRETAAGVIELGAAAAGSSPGGLAGNTTGDAVALGTAAAADGAAGDGCVPGNATGNRGASLSKVLAGLTGDLPFKLFAGSSTIRTSGRPSDETSSLPLRFAGPVAGSAWGGGDGAKADSAVVAVTKTVAGSGSADSAGTVAIFKHFGQRSRLPACSLPIESK